MDDVDFKARCILFMVLHEAVCLRISGVAQVYLALVATCLVAGAVSCSNKTSSGHGEWRWSHCSGVAMENGGRRERWVEQGGDYDASWNGSHQ